MARLKPRQDRQPFRSTILLDGIEIPQAPILDEEGRRLSARIEPSRGGDNRIQLRLSNIWGASRLSDPVSVRYLRPPKVREVNVSPIQGRPSASLTARVDSPDDLTPTDARVEIDRPGRGGPGRVEWLEQRPTLDRKGDYWVASVRDLPLEPGENRFRIWVSNGHGRSREPGRSETITYIPPEQPKREELIPPVVEIVSPGDAVSFSVPRCELEFRVRSATSPREIKLVRLYGSGKHEVAFPHGAEPPISGPWGGTLEKNVNVALDEGENRFELLATNAGGTNRAHITVSYAQPPVQVVIDSLTVPKAGGIEFKPEIRTNNRPEFPQRLPGSWVVLRGRVIWARPMVRDEFQNADLRVRVNGTLCSKLKLAPRPDDSLQVPFETGVRLATPTNRVSVDLAGVPRDAITPGEFTIICEAKDLRQRLHLMVIGVGPYKADQLRDQALAAFKGQLVDPSTNQFESPAFQEDGYLYGPLVGDEARHTRVVNLLAMIRKSLIKPESHLDEAPTEIVVIYYVGDERHTAEGTALHLGTGEGEEVEMEVFSQFFSETRANQVFLLDVTHDPKRDITAEGPPVLDSLESLMRRPPAGRPGPAPHLLDRSRREPGGCTPISGPNADPPGNPSPRLDPQTTGRRTEASL